MASKAVTRKAFVQLSHPVISIDLGHDGGCGNRSGLAISSNNSDLKNRQVKPNSSVDQNKDRGAGESQDRFSHGKASGFKDIDCVDDRF